MRRHGLVTCVGLTILGTACAGQRSSGEGAAGAELQVAAAFYPLVEAASRVGGERVVVTNLTAAGVEPHDLELDPRDVDSVLDSDVLLYLGEGFQPALEDVAADAQGIVVDLLEGQDLNPGGESGIDPHIWLDPLRMQALVGRVAAALEEADPAGASEYAANASELEAEIGALDGELRSGLAECRRETIVTSHDAFGYLAVRYGLTQESISGLSPEGEADPARLDELADRVEREGITTIFTEALAPPDVAETLAREVGVRTAVLNPIEGLTEQERLRGETYVSVMRANLATLREALGCEPAGEV